MDSERPTPLVEDVDGIRRKLEAWFSERRGSRVTIGELNIPEGTGMSNVTLLFNIQWQEGSRTMQSACVGRLQPQIERPVFPDYDLSLQYQVMESIGANSDIPVPTLLGLETDTSILGVQFYVMAYTPGRIPPDMPPYNMDGWLMHEASNEQREAIWYAAVDAMGACHQLDYKELGFEHLAEEGKTPLQQQLEYWQRYHDWGLEGSRHVIGQRALDWLQANQPQDEPTVLCWGDSRIGNVIFNEALDGVAALLDWEMAVLGNPVQDIAWYNYLDATFAEGLGLPRLEGLPSYEDTVARWEHASGFSATHYNYYLIFAGTRYALILSRIMLATGQESEVQGNFACQLLNKHLERIGA
ncbi:phosphotransferase family protein [Halioglobus maricola]|uniref:Phosphotransferase family protein n=1 Tax=Halioglobus maricola TaxID=2601894 RepID=A0A5P9NNY0_9GAMM|nr:phosphotransferase family protein [Halioglobus maricola]QFU76974.1 phosphotransferase family protein [Halioglobus maricola]